jgi:hypothetical protein
MSLAFTIQREDEASSHIDDKEQEALLRKKLADIIDECNCVKKDQHKAAMQVEICPCGNFSCGMIKTLGLPVPIFKEEIERLYPQPRRDRRARELRK